MKSGELAHIEYSKLKGGDTELTERHIIPTFVPHQNIKAIDVSELTEEERVERLALYKEYADYHTRGVKSLFSFEDWISHTQNSEAATDIKWRTFKISNLKELD